MAVNVIVVAVTLMIGGFLLIWITSPRSRAWFEVAKGQPLTWEQGADFTAKAPTDALGSTMTYGGAPSAAETQSLMRP